jgi:hypothetical protein
MYFILVWFNTVPEAVFNIWLRHTKLAGKVYIVISRAQRGTGFARCFKTA